MANAFLLKADLRKDIGKGASRRLRHENKIPAVVYGGDSEALSITLAHNDILRCLNSDSFYSQIIDIEIDGEVFETVLRDLQRHPFKPTILHADFQRVVRGQEINVHVPIHFTNAEKSVGVKAGGILNQHIIDLEISARPSLLPEAIIVDLTNLNMNESIHLSELSLPEGVSITALTHGEDADISVVSIYPPKGPSSDEESEEAASVGDES